LHYVQQTQRAALPPHHRPHQAGKRDDEFIRVWMPPDVIWMISETITATLRPPYFRCCRHFLTAQ
jgi:hypothetical protein